MLIRSSVAPLLTNDDHYSMSVSVSVSVFVPECLEFLRQVMLTDQLLSLINGFIVATICQPSPSGSSESFNIICKQLRRIIKILVPRYAYCVSLMG